MKTFLRKITLILSLTGLSFTAHAQFGSGVVYDPTQSAHAIQQIEQGQNIFTNSVKLADNAIATYTVRKQNGEGATYNPSRLRGIDAYTEVERSFSVGDRIQMTAPNRELHVANRALGTIDQIAQDGLMTVKMDSGKTLSFDPQTLRHFDHGYAVTSHSSQGLTAERVLVNVDTATHPDLISSRFAYVSISRASHNAQIYTDKAASLGFHLGYDAAKISAIDMTQTPNALLNKDLAHERVGEAFSLSQ